MFHAKRRSAERMVIVHEYLRATTVFYYKHEHVVGAKCRRSRCVVFSEFRRFAILSIQIKHQVIRGRIVSTRRYTISGVVYC